MSSWRPLLALFANVANSGELENSPRKSYNFNHSNSYLNMSRNTRYKHMRSKIRSLYDVTKKGLVHSQIDLPCLHAPWLLKGQGKLEDRGTGQSKSHLRQKWGLLGLCDQELLRNGRNCVAVVLYVRTSGSENAGKKTLGHCRACSHTTCVVVVSNSRPMGFFLYWQKNIISIRCAFSFKIPVFSLGEESQNFETAPDPPLRNFRASQLFFSKKPEAEGGRRTKKECFNF